MQVYGHIEIFNLQAKQVVKLNVDLDIGVRPNSNQLGSITLVKSREDTFGDIVQGLPAQYRVTFPLQNPMPIVLSISVNDRRICTGHRRPGQHIRVLCWKHTWYTQLLSQNMGQNNNLPLGSKVLRPITPNPVQTAEQSTLPSLGEYTCGKPSSALSNLLSINGQLVNKGQFPWIVPLFDRTYPRSPKYFCGSTIISRKYLITAAHCVYGIEEFMPAEDILAVPGMHNIDNFMEKNAEFRDVAAVLPHPEYAHDDEENDADLAVLRLREPLSFTDYIIPICHWRGDNDLQKIVGQEATVAGWGFTEEGPTSMPTYIRTNVVSRERCNDNWAQMYRANDRIFCTDGHGESAPCNGDSGSGLALKIGNRYILRGVVSRGKVDRFTLKCDPTKYAVYTDVAPFRFWLKKIMN
ncbi:CLIP domain-containing serine protease B15-like [Sabethes cyaneus]|uniref:CLIP domain-containing serine protease B15-like n=1 Tax=Sabethes cyaneus TaxID=53552 RepID=UPI00237E2E74|nr:CLIP domain-containing serine protease B15-like [Sabethes cyaneus]